MAYLKMACMIIFNTEKVKFSSFRCDRDGCVFTSHDASLRTFLPKIQLTVLTNLIFIFSFRKVWNCYQSYNGWEIYEGVHGYRKTL